MKVHRRLGGDMLIRNLVYFHQTTGRYTREDTSVHIHRCEKLTCTNLDIIVHINNFILVNLHSRCTDGYFHQLPCSREPEFPIVNDVMIDTDLLLVVA
jgi:hypothetical protein